MKNTIASNCQYNTSGLKHHKEQPSCFLKLTGCIIFCRLVQQAFTSSASTSRGMARLLLKIVVIINKKHRKPLREIIADKQAAPSPDMVRPLTAPDSRFGCWENIH